MKLLRTILVFYSLFFGFESSASPSNQRIVTLAPSAAEIVAAVLGKTLKQKIVGVTDHTDYPKWLGDVERVGPYSNWNLEKVVSLRPSVAFVTEEGHVKDRVSRLEELGVRIVSMKTRRLADVTQSIRSVGGSLNLEEESNRLANQYEGQLDHLRRKFENRSPVKTLIHVSIEPLIVVGSGSFISDALSVVGGRNVFGDLEQAYPRPSAEEVLKRKPDKVIYLGMDSSSSRSVQAVRAFWKRLGVNFVETISDQRLIRPSHRIVEALEDLGNRLHGG